MVKKVLFVVSFVLVCLLIFLWRNGLLAFLFLPFPQCDFEGGWGQGQSQRCSCFGIKITVSDSLAVDGDYITVCAGIPTYLPTEQPHPPTQIACTLEAKICPDGSSVGRSGPNCEFAPCPGESSPQSQ